jgi:hypothetical protein
LLSVPFILPGENMYKIICIIALIIPLSGCFYQTVDFNDIRKAELFCKDRGGVYKISSHFIGEERVFCMDGDKEYTDKVMG